MISVIANFMQIICPRLKDTYIHCTKNFYDFKRLTYPASFEYSNIIFLYNINIIFLLCSALILDPYQKYIVSFYLSWQGTIYFILTFVYLLLLHFYAASGKIKMGIRMRELRIWVKICQERPILSCLVQ